jgi:hypothetical protein
VRGHLTLIGALTHSKKQVRDMYKTREDKPMKLLGNTQEKLHPKKQVQNPKYIRF